MSHNAVISTEPPCLSNAEAQALVQQHFALAAVARPLLSERDQNFHLKAADGRQFVLKIANAAETPSFTRFQIEGLLHIGRQNTGSGSLINSPDILPAVGGESHIKLTLGGASHVVRIVSYLPGVPLSEVTLSATLSRNLGAYLAHLGQALADFDYPVADEGLLWDMKSALKLRDLLPFVADPGLAEQIAACLSDFEDIALPQFDTLRSQVIHNDFNPDNVLIDPDDLCRPVGVIDFGDMHRSPLIIDLAVAASYLRTVNGDPLQHIVQFVAGYHEVTPLDKAETDLLFTLILTRLCATISILSWRQALRGADDLYLQNTSSNESSAEEFFRCLLEIPREKASDQIRKACDTPGAG